MKVNRWSDMQYRLNVMLGALVVGVLFIGVMTLLLGRPEAVGAISPGGVLFGREAIGTRMDAYYPFTIQNVMWLVFFIGLGELWIRLQAGRVEALALTWKLLPEDESSMLRAKDLSVIYRDMARQAGADGLFLPRLVRRVILQFQTSRSIDQANSLLNSSLELLQHEIDLRYNLIRYLVWLIPSIGFMGTVIGIAFALSDATGMPPVSDQEAVKIWLGTLTGSLGVAFNTTLVALIMSAILMFLLHLAQEREESVLNHAGQYCLDNLINRLYEE